MFRNNLTEYLKMASKTKTAAPADNAVPAEEATTAPAQSADKFKIKKNLTLPVHKFQEEIASYLKVECAMFRGKKMGGRGDAAAMEPATLVEVTNLETGEVEQLIVSKVILSTFEESYPNDGYVGKGFRIIKHARKTGKNYNTYSIAEIDLPA
jgi:hypothetical protein